MLKKIFLMITLCVSLTGCWGTVTPDQVASSVEFCAGHGGLQDIWVNTWTEENTARCNESGVGKRLN